VRCESGNKITILPVNDPLLALVTLSVTLTSCADRLGSSSGRRSARLYSKGEHMKKERVDDTIDLQGDDAISPFMSAGTELVPACSTDVTRGTSPTNAAYWLPKIKEGWRNSVAAILVVSRDCAEAFANLDVTERNKLVARLPMDRTTFPNLAPSARMQRYMTRTSSRICPQIGRSSISLRIAQARKSAAPSVHRCFTRIALGASSTHG